MHSRRLPIESRRTNGAPKRTCARHPLNVQHALRVNSVWARWLKEHWEKRHRRVWRSVMQDFGVWFRCSSNHFKAVRCISLHCNLFQRQSEAFRCILNQKNCQYFNWYCWLEGTFLLCGGRRTEKIERLLQFLENFNKKKTFYSSREWINILLSEESNGRLKLTGKNWLKTIIIIIVSARTTLGHHPSPGRVVEWKVTHFIPLISPFPFTLSKKRRIIDIIDFERSMSSLVDRTA